MSRVSCVCLLYSRPRGEATSFGQHCSIIALHGPDLDWSAGCEKVRKIQKKKTDSGQILLSIK